MCVYFAVCTISTGSALVGAISHHAITTVQQFGFGAKNLQFVIKFNYYLWLEVRPVFA
jgi:hypothetical protein